MHNQDVQKHAQSTGKHRHTDSGPLHHSGHTHALASGDPYDIFEFKFNV